jgi:hypothetical protein
MAHNINVMLKGTTVALKNKRHFIMVLKIIESHFFTLFE